MKEPQQFHKYLIFLPGPSAILGGRFLFTVKIVCVSLVGRKERLTTVKTNSLSYLSPVYK